MGNDGGWQREDGIGKDMWQHMAESPTPRSSRRSDETPSSHCPYALRIGEYKEGTTWDAQTFTAYCCYMGSRRGMVCRSDKEMCEKGLTAHLFPNSPAAHSALTGGLPTS